MQGGAIRMQLGADSEIVPEALELNGYGLNYAAQELSRS